MWKCKHCGGTDFKVEIDGYIELDLKKNGDFDYKKDTLNIRNIHPYIHCCKCGNEDEEKAIKRVLEDRYVFFETYDKYGETTEEVYFGKYVVKDEYSEYRVFDEDEFKELYDEVK